MEIVIPFDPTRLAVTASLMEPTAPAIRVNSTVFVALTLPVAPTAPTRHSTRSYTHVPVACLTAARVFRDCSLRGQSSQPERKACRTLMRQAAIKWRGGLAMGDL